MKILIDPGHGCDTPGKRSPDGRHREWAWTREVSRMLVDELTRRGIEARCIVTESRDISLGERCRRVNAVCATHGKGNVLLVSIHNNAAAADGRWHEARGFTVFVSPNASEKSKLLARSIYDKADENGLRGNRAVPPCRYWTASLAMCRDTHCPAVLTENMFQDNEEDVRLLESDEGKRRIVKAHADGIAAYINRVR